MLAFVRITPHPDESAGPHPGPAIASEGLQVSVPIVAHRSLVRRLLVLVQDPQVLQALGLVAPEVAQGFGGLLCGPFGVPPLYSSPSIHHAPLQARA